MNPAPREPVLIAAVSARALAAAARAAGYAPLVADLFADLDTRRLAVRSLRVPGTLARGPSGPALLAALDRLACGAAPAGLVLGSGFEARPRLLRALARRHALLGNRPGTVARIKDPHRFAALCASLGVPHPDTGRSVPDGGRLGDWLEKRRGGAGGAHVGAASARPRRGRYVQRRVAGRPISALFAADGRRSLVLGFSEQWPDPAGAHRFRYAGAVRPADTGRHAAGMAAAVARLAAAAGLVGLNSADFLLQEDGFTMLEINPRPGASLDVFPKAALFALHVASCRGALPADAPDFPGAAAALTVYARRPLALAAGFAWPDWAADLQPPGPVRAGAPLCTVLAEDAEPEAACRLVRGRAAAILARAEAA